MGAGGPFLDYNNDGWLDVFLVNGIDWPACKRRSTYPALYRNNQHGTFTDVAREAVLAVEFYGMGCAVADYDNDGDLDILVTSCGGAAKLFRNDGGNRNNWVTFQPVGHQSNRDGLGAVVTVKTGSFFQSRMIRSGSGYCSQSQLRVTFGLGKAARVDQVEMVWPSGKKQLLTAVPINRILVVDEEKGIGN